MGNKASVLFGAGPQNVLSDSEEHASEGGGDNSKSSTSSSTLPVALSAEEQADAKRYAELFGGKPKVKSSKGKPGSRQQRQQIKKKQRFGEDDPWYGSGKAGTERGDSGGDGGSNSGSCSPYRGKATWAVGTAAESSGKGKESAPQAVSEEVRRQQVIAAVSAKIEDLENERMSDLDKKNMEAVEAKIEDLEKEKSEGNDEGAEGGEAAGSNVVEQDEGALVPEGAKGNDTEAARARAAVSNALFAGTDQNPPAADELLNGPSGASIKGGAGGAGVVDDMPPTSARTASARPPPQRNFKAKN